ncbi:hypothetical protein BH09PAT2_BH09PAT2_10040 [soil metagenome]
MNALNDNLLAQILEIKTPGSSVPGGGSVKLTGPLVGINSLSDLINLALSFLVPLAGVVIFLIIVWGGYDILMSNGNADNVSKGQKKITAAIIGFVLLTASYFIVKLLGFIFGVGSGTL